MTFRKPTEQELLLSDQEYLVTHNIQVRGHSPPTPRPLHKL
jgi:hypothetical protein